MNVRFIFIKLSETWQANKLQSELSKDNKLAEPSWGSWVLWDFFTGLSMISWSHATLYVLFLIFLVFFIYIIPVMKLLDWLSWSKGTSRSASDRVSKVYRFQTSRLIRGCPGWPGCCLVTVTLVSLLWSCHTSSIHTCLLVHSPSWAHVPELFSQQPPNSQLASLFGEELWNHFDVVLWHTHYMMSTFGQHHSWVYSWQTQNIDVSC